jgi:hypothetical protein
MNHQILAGRAIAISISDSPDMPVLGLGKEHLEDAMTEIARHLLALGARLLYGGDLREGGFTQLLFELINRHRRNSEQDDSKVAATNYLAWPVHIAITAAQLSELANALNGTAEIVRLQLDGTILTAKHWTRRSKAPATREEWAEGLTAMRRTMAASSNARIVLGGRVEGYKGRMPGVAEEALMAIERKQPLYLLGGFGGCGADIARTIGFAIPRADRADNWPGHKRFVGRKAQDLNNGLTVDESATLAATTHVDEAVTLILRGLIRISGLEGLKKN